MSQPLPLFHLAPNLCLGCLVLSNYQYARFASENRPIRVMRVGTMMITGTDWGVRRQPWEKQFWVHPVVSNVECACILGEHGIHVPICST